MVVLNGVLDGDEVVTNIAALQQLLSAPEAAAVRAVVSTTSCFAPRACDQVEQVGCALDFANSLPKCGLVFLYIFINFMLSLMLTMY